MFGIELDTVKKIELGFCLVVLGLAGYFFFAGTRVTPDPTVAPYTLTISIGADGKPAGKNNPEDPTKSYQLTYFAIDDGKLIFKEYPKRNNGSRAEISFDFDQKKKTYDHFQTPMQIVEAYTDPARRALSMAAVAQIFNKSQWGMFSALRLDAQISAALAASYTAMVEAVELYDADVAMGTVDAGEYNKVMSALDEYRASGPAEVKDNPKKAAAAKKVMEVGLGYYKKIQDTKLQKISAWADDAAKMLTDDQKKKAVDLANSRLENMSKSGSFSRGNGRPRPTN